MRPIILDDRLACAASLFPACAYGADIGADHGRLSCYLLSVGRCQKMCVADISADSLSKARLLLAEAQLSERADFRVGDGLTVLHRAAEAIAVLGMGGHTLSKILLGGQSYLKGASLILSAHTHLELLRQTLTQIGYAIETEKIAMAGGRFYVVLRAVPGQEQYTEKQLFLGPRLMEAASPEYLDFLLWRIQFTQRKQGKEAQQEKEWLKEEENRVRSCIGH